MSHVWLIGMMGTGKSSVGLLVAEQLQVPFADVDALIVARERRTINEIFEEGEQVFRDFESDEIASLATKASLVVATGGGAVLDPANVTIMRSSGSTVLLTADTATIAARLLGTSDRPVIEGPDTLNEIAIARRLIYEKSADHVIDTTNRDVDAVAKEVLECVAM